MEADKNKEWSINDVSLIEAEEAETGFTRYFLSVVYLFIYQEKHQLFVMLALAKKCNQSTRFSNWQKYIFLVAVSSASFTADCATDLHPKIRKTSRGSGHSPQNSREGSMVGVAASAIDDHSIDSDEYSPPPPKYVN